MQLKDVKIAINSVINITFDAKIIAYRVEENIPRPSFKVFLSDLSSVGGMNNTVEKNVITRIYYYPKNPDDCELELLEIRDKLSDLFSNFTQVGEDVIKFNNYEDDCLNDMIQASFEVNFVSTQENETEYPDMDIIEFELKVGE